MNSETGKFRKRGTLGEAGRRHRFACSSKSGQSGFSSLIAGVAGAVLGASAAPMI
jgi:hypothetical protein